MIKNWKRDREKILECAADIGLGVPVDCACMSRAICPATWHKWIERGKAQLSAGVLEEEAEVVVKLSEQSRDLILPIIDEMRFSDDAAMKRCSVDILSRLSPQYAKTHHHETSVSFFGEDTATEALKKELERVGALSGAFMSNYRTSTEEEDEDQNDE